MTLTVGSLFSGIGGMDLGFERAGFQIKWHSEIDPYASRVLKKHWPEVPNYGDITALPGSIPTSDLECDVLAGGFPCQDISLAGKGAGLNGSRSGLWWEMARLIGVLRPRYVCLENVAALAARGLPAVLGFLSEIGYDAEWTIVSAASVGAPHVRERLFIVAYASNECTERRSRSKSASTRDVGRGTYHDGRSAGDVNETPVPDGNGKGLAQRQGIGGDAWAQLAPIERGGDEGRTLRHTNGAPPHAHAPAGRPRQATRQSSGWEPEPDVGRVANGVPNRAHRLRGLGNAVVPQVAEYVARQIKRHAGEAP